MAIRIVGVDLPQDKRGEIALTYIFGIGRSASNSILAKAGVDKNIKVKDWTDDQAAKIREVIGEGYKVEGDLRSEVQLNIKRLMDIGCYRGVRHRIGLPVRGQSTNAQGQEEDGCKQEESHKIISSRNGKESSRSKEAESQSGSRWGSPYPLIVQQYHRVADQQ